MPPFDLLIRGGVLVEETGERRADLAVRDGRVAAWLEPGADAGEAARVVDVDGALVVPGGLDAHVHFDFGLPPQCSQPYAQGSLAGLYGGTTTVVDFGFRAPGGGSILEAVQQKRADAEGEMYTDFGLHVIVAGEVGEAELAEVPQVIGAGVNSFKLFMNFHDFWPGDAPTKRLLEEVGKHGGIAVFHCEGADHIEMEEARLLADGPKDYRFTEDSRPAWVETEATARAAHLAHAADCPLFVFHVTCAGAMEEVRTAQARGWDVFAETCHNYIVFSKDDVVNRPDGANWGNYPPPRPPQNRDAIWRGIEDGTICHVSTDDYTAELAVRNAGGLDLPGTPAGHNGIETRMTVLFSEAVSKRGMTPSEFVGLSSTRIARRLGMYPRKGTLLPGADADIAVIDPGARGTIRLEDLHTVDYSIWDGFDYVGTPVMTVKSGEIVIEDGRYVGKGPRGEFLARGEMKGRTEVR
jgi:dihydropyrimidinase